MTSHYRSRIEDCHHRPVPRRQGGRFEAEYFECTPIVGVPYWQRTWAQTLTESQEPWLCKDRARIYSIVSNIGGPFSDLLHIGLHETSSLGLSKLSWRKGSHLLTALGRRCPSTMCCKAWMGRGHVESYCCSL